MRKKIRRANPFLDDAADARRCPVCRHAEPHNRGEYEDTHVRCEHVRVTKHLGVDCGHKRYNAECSDCWIDEERCECSSEDRLIADLYDRIEKLEGAR